ncbi:MAG: nuclear transport factor 2 family protein [Comamonadaceae bacterium]|nr:MAG: nuclear transport factor 2 family protein [Comamonadaceae bacterium]
MTEQDKNELLQSLLDRVRVLEAKVQTVEDTESISKLTRMYGYYLDKALWDEMLPLFTDDCSIEISALGVYLGKRQAEVLFKELLGKGPAMSDANGLVYGRLYNHLIVQGIVHVEEGGLHANARWRCFMQSAEYGVKATWGEGPYEIRYRKEDGLWRISHLHFYRTFHTPFEEGWAKAKSPAGGVRANLPPDLPPSVAYEPYPGVFVPPFHYANPVSGSLAYTRSDPEKV